MSGDIAGGCNGSSMDTHAFHFGPTLQDSPCGLVPACVFRVSSGHFWGTSGGFSALERSRSRLGTPLVLALLNTGRTTSDPLARYVGG